MADDRSANSERRVEGSSFQSLENMLSALPLPSSDNVVAEVVAVDVPSVELGAFQKAEQPEATRLRVMKEIQSTLQSPDTGWSRDFFDVRLEVARVKGFSRVEEAIKKFDGPEYSELVRSTNLSLGRSRDALVPNMGDSEEVIFVTKYNEFKQALVAKYAEEFFPMSIIYEWGEMFDQYCSMQEGDSSAFLVTRRGSISETTYSKPSVDVGVSDAFGFLTEEQQEILKTTELEIVYERLRLIASETLKIGYAQAVPMFGALGLLQDSDTLGELYVAASSPEGAGIKAYLLTLITNPVVTIPVGEVGSVIRVDVNTGSRTRNDKR